MATSLVGTFGKAVRSVKKAYGFGRYSMKKRPLRYYGHQKTTAHRQMRVLKYAVKRQATRRRHQQRRRLGR